ncbi:MAG: efflux RND transporter permease subunit, partial [Gallionellaceae bacterium]|nr:efflux RND transporter permease subunit [Gallionellaceae bacterium]
DGDHEHDGEKKGFFGWFNRTFLRTATGYRNTVNKLLTHKTPGLLAYGAVVVVTGWLFAHLPNSFLPEEDQGYFVTMMQLPPGATRERTMDVLQEVEKYYLGQPEVDHVIGVLGFSFLGRGQNTATAFVRLKDWSDEKRKGKDHTAAALVQRANMALMNPMNSDKAVPASKRAMIITINVPPIPELAATGGFDFRLQDRSGMGRDALRDARNQLLGMASADTARLAGVRPEGQEPAPQLMLDVDRLKAQTLGVNMDDLNSMMQSTLGVNYINDFVRMGRVLRVQMQADAQTRSSIDQIMRLPVRTANDGLVPLSEIASPRWVLAPPRLERYNGLPAMKISGSPAPGRSSGDAMDGRVDAAAKLPPGVGYEWSGSSKQESLSGAQAPMLFALSVVAVFLCLAALYESWSIPVAALLVVPIGIFGSLLAVTLRGMPNDVYFKVGLVVVIGLAVKNAILIIQFARDAEKRGEDLLQSTLDACRLRFRPILMTSIAFVFGVLPLAISTGAGANGRHAIGTGVMGGMLSATVLAIFLIPVFFMMVRRFFPGKPDVKHEENEHD